jgi:putative phosphoesterase
MRIGILSDTHDQVARTARALAELEGQGVAALVHCGDLTCPEVVYQFEGSPPAYFVFGNNDFDRKGLSRAMSAVGGVCLGDGGAFELAGKTLAVTHGDSLRQMRRLTGEGPDYLFFGHTHVAADLREGRTRFVNPGALHRATPWTVAVLDLVDDSLQLLTIRDTG